MASDTKKHIKTRTHAIQFQFVVINAPNGAGTVKGGFTIILGIMFKAVKIYTIMVFSIICSKRWKMRQNKVAIKLIKKGYT